MFACLSFIFGTFSGPCCEKSGQKSKSKVATFRWITKEVLLVNNGTFRGRKATLDSMIRPAYGDTTKESRGYRSDDSSDPTSILRLFCFQGNAPYVVCSIDPWGRHHLNPHVIQTAHTLCALPEQYPSCVSLILAAEVSPLILTYTRLHKPCALCTLPERDSPCVS